MRSAKGFPFSLFECRLGREKGKKERGQFCSLIEDDGNRKEKETGIRCFIDRVVI